MGAMAPEWNADARACWYGLTPAHGRAHLLRALLEGSAYALRDVLEAMRGAGVEPERIVCVAGGARSELWRQIRADVTGVPVGVAADVETTARGAAMLAASGAGLHASVADASAAMSREGGEPLLPDPERQAIYDDGVRALPRAVRRAAAGVRAGRRTRLSRRRASPCAERVGTAMQLPFAAGVYISGGVLLVIVIVLLLILILRRR